MKLLNKHGRTLHAIFEKNGQLPETYRTLKANADLVVPDVYVIAGWKNIQTSEYDLTEPSFALKQRDPKKWKLMFEVSFVKVR
jgi:hypothetical protein